MGAMQAVIGWWMVYSGLQQKPAVSHFRLATHLMSAFTLFAFTFWFALKLLYPKETIKEKGRTYITLAFSAFDKNRIDLKDLSDFLGVKLSYIPKTRQLLNA